MDNVREYVRKNTVQIRKRLVSADQKSDEQFKTKGYIFNASNDFNSFTMINCKLNDGPSSINKLREYFFSKFKFSLLHNYKTCGKQKKIILSQEHIDHIARKVEHGIFCSSATSKFNLSYKFMATQKVTEIDKNTIENIFCAILNENDNINGKEKDRKTEDDLRIINISASSEHDLVVSKNSGESKENVCDSEEGTVNENKSLCFDSFDYSSDMISKFSDSICSIEDRTNDLNESDLNSINLSTNADNSLKNNVENLKSTEILENKAYYNTEKINDTDQNSKPLINDTVTAKAQEIFNKNENVVLGSDETEVSDKRESESTVQRKSFKIILRDCTEYGENFELMDQIEYGVMNFEDPDPNISANEDESDDEYTDADEIRLNNLAQDKIDTVPISLSNVNEDDADNSEVGNPPKKLRMSNETLRNIENIEEETLNVLRPIIDRYLSTIYVPNYYYYKHIFRCIHKDILKKNLYDPTKIRIYAIKKIKSKKYYNYMYEMIGGKYHYIPREVDDYMLSPELHPYEYRVLPML